MIQAVLFDLDETLHDRSRSLETFVTHQFRAFASLMSSVPPETWKIRWIELDQGGYAPKQRVYPELAREFGLDPEVAAALLRHYNEQFYLYAEPAEHLDEILSFLKELGVRTGIITNGHTSFQRKVIQKLNLDCRMDICLISEQEKLRKPDRRIFLKAASLLGVSPNVCLFVGDHPLNDICGAQDAGMKTAWISRGKSWPIHNRKPGHIIRHLAGLRDVLSASIR